MPSKYPRLDDDGRHRIARELDVIEEKDFPGYFLIVHGIVTEARRRGILCQGRGSAAASAVCYLLGITAVDPILYRLPFERFLATTRTEEPDIDVDFDSDRREEIIQWVYAEYGRERAAQVANVIQYRPKNAVRDMARALGHSPGQQDAWSRQVDGWGAGLEPVEGHDIPEKVLAYAGELLKAPRHLGIHSGGMVLTARPVGEVVPVEHARMENRTVIQWDKDDSAFMGLVKFDLLGLGMLAALQHCFDLIRESTGEEWTLETIPKEEPAVYDMLCRADSIGVFQVESRAQIGLLPRLQPRAFYDLAIPDRPHPPRPHPGRRGASVRAAEDGQGSHRRGEPGTGDSRRGAGGVRDPVPAQRSGGHPQAHAGHSDLQEQLIQMATAIGDCTADEADLLRRAMGSKRGLEKIEKVRDKLYAGMARRGLVDEAADRIYAQIQAFSNFGFAESHSLSFALLVYASSWVKLHYPAAFLAGLLRSQPMGFYSAATLTADARRHGVEVRRPDLHVSGATETLEPLVDGAPRKPTVSGRVHRRPAAAHAPLRSGCAGRIGRAPQGRELRGTAGAQRHPWDRCADGGEDRRRTGCERPVPGSERPGAANGCYRRTRGGSGHRRRFRLSGPGASRGHLAGRCGGRRPLPVPAGDDGRRAASAVRRPDQLRAPLRRPVGDRCVDRRSSDGALP